MLGHGAVSELPVSTISGAAAPPPQQFESSSPSRIARAYRVPRAAIGYLWSAVADDGGAPPPPAEFESSSPTRQTRPYRAPRASLQVLNSEGGADVVDGGDASVVTRPRFRPYQLPRAAIQFINGGDVQDTPVAPAEPTPFSVVTGQRYRPYSLPRGARGMGRFGAPMDVNGPVQTAEQSWQGIAPGSQLGLRRAALRRAQRLRGVRWHAMPPAFGVKMLIEAGVVSSPQIANTQASSPWEEEGVVSSPQIETRAVVD